MNRLPIGTYIAVFVVCVASFLPWVYLEVLSVPKDTLSGDTVSINVWSTTIKVLSTKIPGWVLVVILLCICLLKTMEIRLDIAIWRAVAPVLAIYGMFHTVYLSYIFFGIFTQTKGPIIDVTDVTLGIGLPLTFIGFAALLVTTIREKNSSFQRVHDKR